MSETDEARERAEEAAKGGLVDRMLGMVTNAGTGAVFGAAVERDGRTVIPVARSRFGFGGGRGIAAGEEGSGAGDVADGAGGALMADPVGYIEMGPEGAAFRPIVSAYPSSAFLLAAGLCAWLTMAGLARFVRAFRR